MLLGGQGETSWRAAWQNTWWKPWPSRASGKSTASSATASTPRPTPSARRGSIQWIDVRHEETTAFAAGAEAQLAGQLAVCAGSCGPGNLHLINGLYDAHRSGAPVLAIAAHIPSSEVGTGYFQETHPDQLFRECSHYCELVSNPSQAPRVIQSAVQHAMSKRGVSVVVFPGDVATLETPSDAVPCEPVGAVPLLRPADADLGRLADLVNGRRRWRSTAASAAPARTARWWRWP